MGGDSCCSCCGHCFVCFILAMVGGVGWGAALSFAILGNDSKFCPVLDARAHAPVDQATTRPRASQPVIWRHPGNQMNKQGIVRVVHNL